MASNTKLTWAAGLSIPVIPLLGIGLVDPFEGLGALVLGIALLVVVRVLSRVGIPKLAWISFTVSAVLMAAILAIAIFAPHGEPIMVEDATVQNPLAMAGLWLMAPQRVATLVMVAGLIVYTVRLFKARFGKAATGKATSKKAAK